MSTVTLEGSFKCDALGFVSHECPGCERRFKTKPNAEGRSPTIEHCPFCAHDGKQCWFTPEQIEYLRGLALSKVVSPALKKLDRSIQNLGRMGGSVRVTGRLAGPAEPPSPVERDYDMPAATQFACCGESIRHDVGVEPTRCVCCGTAAS